jgi:hypothetical protein
MGMEGSDAMPSRAATAFNPSSRFAEHTNRQNMHGSPDVNTSLCVELVPPFAQTHLHACHFAGVRVVWMRSSRV